MLQYEEQKSRLTAVESDIKELGDALGLDYLRREVESLELQSTAPDFWNDLANAQKIQQKLSQLKQKIEKYEKLQSLYEDTLVLIEMADEEGDLSMLDEVTEGVDEALKSLEEQRLSTLLIGEYDSNNAILTFHAGAGGTEAQDWNQMLVRMYTHWGEQHGFKVNMVDFLDGEEAGLKSAVLTVNGINAYGYLKGENGVHRLVRCSPFDSSGRRHTSFASLEVMPEITADVNIEIRDEDLKVDTYRSSGAGGQHVNKTESAIRITHIPTGIVVACQNERSQLQNREVAMTMLKSKLLEIKEREHLDKIEDIKGVQKDIAWGSQIRSYVFMPYTLVKDHRTGFESGNVGAVMDGDLDGFVNAYLKAASKNELGNFSSDD
ncbi:MAG: peptide chain release factor 2 [Ruminococcaceae bacterium]|nr:peptide chain release factor 2 [Oscillospiraceae bacterium]